MPDLSHIIALLEASKYFLIFAGCYIEGTVVMMGTGLLWHVGQVEFLPAYIALLLGDVLSDIMWYFIGLFGARKFMDRWGHMIGMTPEVVEKVERRFHTYHTPILIVSKLSMGFGFAVATLTTAGMLRIPFYRFFIINFLGGLVWVLMMMMIGYYFGNILELVPRNLQIASVAFACVLAFFGLKYATKRLASMDW